jgi:hypothetical protein
MGLSAMLPYTIIHQHALLLLLLPLLVLLQVALGSARRRD